MKTCNIIGCNCQGTKPTHRTMKAHKKGFHYYACWYGPRFGDEAYYRNHGYIVTRVEKEKLK